MRRRDQDPDGPGADWNPGPQAHPGTWEPPGAADVAGWPAQPSLRVGVHHGPGDPVRPATMVFPPGSGTSFSIGRTQDCDMRIADLSVSRRHAQLERSQDGWLLSDLGSHNGTRVNGWLVREPVPVRPGDILQFGSAVFVITGPENPPVSAGPQQERASPLEGAPGGMGGTGSPPMSRGLGGSAPR